MIVATAHPSRPELARYALTADPAGRRHDGARRHLQAGCSDCETVFFALCRMPPEVRDAAAGRTSKWIRPRRIEARGLRSNACADYQLVCGVGAYELDVLVSELEETPTLKYQGQVTLAGRIHEPAADLPLSLIDAMAPETLLGTRTNDFGEFGMASQQDGCFGLRLGTAPDAPCVLVWEGWNA